MPVFADLAFRSEVRKRSDLGSITYRALCQDATLPDKHVVSKRAVFNHSIGTDVAVRADPRLPEQLHKWLNYRIGRDLNLRIDHAGFRLVDRYSGCHEARRCCVP